MFAIGRPRPTFITSKNSSCSKIVAFLEEQIGNTARFKTASSERSKQWSLFYTTRYDRRLFTVYDLLLVQTVYQKVFEDLLWQHFTNKDQNSSDSEGGAALTLNA